MKQNFVCGDCFGSTDIVGLGIHVINVLLIKINTLMATYLCLRLANTSFFFKCVRTGSRALHMDIPCGGDCRQDMLLLSVRQNGYTITTTIFFLSRSLRVTFPVYVINRLTGKAMKELA